MDNNLKFFDNFGMHLSVLDRDLATPPVTPVNGDTCIIAVDPVGDWSARTVGDVAMYSGNDLAWRFATPRPGWLCYIEDEEKLSVFKAGGWSIGIDI
jgi:hypothetical protein